MNRVFLEAFYNCGAGADFLIIFWYFGFQVVSETEGAKNRNFCILLRPIFHNFAVRFCAFSRIDSAALARACLGSDVLEPHFASTVFPQWS